MTKRVARRGTRLARPPYACDLAGGVTNLKGAEEHEEGGVDEFVVQDLVGSASPASESESVDADCDETEVAEGGEGEESPVVALNECETCAVEDSNDAQRDEKRRDGAGLDGEEADVEAEH